MNQIDIDQLVQDLDNWAIPADQLASIKSRSRESLDEVKALVDYHDKAASAMLTIVAFLTAAASLVFQRFSSDYFWPGWNAIFSSFAHFVTSATYVVFLTYLVLVAFSAVRVFAALIPAYAVAVQQHWVRGGPKNGTPFSALWYKGILSVSPTQWGMFFTSLQGTRNVAGVARGSEADELYAKFAIIESYLVADDADKKVRLVSAAHALLKWSMRSLIVFAVLFSINTVSAKPDRVAAPVAAPASSGVHP